MGVHQRLSSALWSRHAQPVRHEKRGRNTRMMSCDAQRQLTASSERFSRASPTIWSTGERAGVRLALKVHEVRRDVHRAYTRCRPTPGPARARPRRRDLSSRGASARENAVVPAAPAPKLLRCAAGVDCFENPCLGWKERPKGSGLVPDAGICSFSSPRSASELIKAAAARAKADPDAPEGLPVDMARKTHKGAKGVAGALARAQLATASLGNFDAMRRRSRRASAAPSGPRTATRPRASPVVHGRRRAQGRPGHRVRAPRGVGPRPARAAPAAPRRPPRRRRGCRWKTARSATASAGPRTSTCPRTAPSGGRSSRRSSRRAISRRRRTRGRRALRSARGLSLIHI